MGQWPNRWGPPPMRPLPPPSRGMPVTESMAMGSPVNTPPPAPFQGHASVGYLMGSPANPSLVSIKPSLAHKVETTGHFNRNFH